MRFISQLAAIALLVTPVAVYAQTAAAPPVPPPAPSTSPSQTPAPAAQSPTTPAPGLPAGSVNLRLKYTQGEVLKYHMTMGMTMNMTTSVNGQAMPMNTNTSTDMMMIQTVQQVDAQGNATILAQVENPVMSMSLNGQSFPMPQTAVDQLKTGFIEVMTPTGKMLSMKSNAAPTGGASGAASSPFGAAGMSGMFGPGGIGSISGLPDHPVKVGDIWRTSAAIASVGMQLYVKMSLIGLDQSSGSTIATIATKYYADMKPSGASTVPLTGQLTGTGHNTFDVDRGELTGVTTTMNMDSTATPSSAAGPIGMKMTMTMQMDLVSAG